MTLPDGLYDQLLTEALRDAVTRTTDAHAHSLKPLTAEDAPERLADTLAAQLSRILDDLHGDGAEKLRQQLDLVNFLLVSLKQRLGKRADAAETLSEPPQILQAIHQQSPKPAIPETGLAFPWLFTAGKGSPSLLTELRRELAACDQVDILVSFITHSGVRKLLDILQSITAVGPIFSRVPARTSRRCGKRASSRATTPPTRRIARRRARRSGARPATS